MIVYGRGTGQSVMGQAGRHVCPSCKEEAGINVTVVYTYFHIWYLLSFLTGREYFLVCDNCQTAVQVDKATAKAQCPNDNIPFLRRRGWLLVLAVVALFVGLSAFRNWETERKTRQYLANPVSGDLVLANLALVEGSGFTSDNPRIKNGVAYGGLLFLGTTGDDDWAFATTTQANNTISGFRSFLKSQGKNLKFDFENPVFLQGEAMEKLHKGKVIVEVIRGLYDIPSFDEDEEDAVAPVTAGV